MKRFCLKCLLLLSLLGIVFYLGGAAYRQTNTYKNLEITEETTKYHSLPEKIDAAAFGASHGRDAFPIFPAADSFFNFSLSSQTPQYDEKVLLQHKDRFTDDALIILTVSYISPFWIESAEQFENKQPRYYRILDAENIIDVDIPKYYLGRFPLF